MGNFFNKPQDLSIDQILKNYGIITVEKLDKTHDFIKVNGKSYCSENNNK